MAISHQLPCRVSGARHTTLIPTLVIATAVAVALVVASPLVQAQTYTVLYRFTGGPDGATPYAGLAADAAGNLYGTAGTGGSGFGTVHRLSNENGNWTFTPLYSFIGGNHGSEPLTVTVGPDGTLYGTTAAGGGNGCGTGAQGPGCGTVFNLRPPPTACATALCPWTDCPLPL